MRVWRKKEEIRLKVMSVEHLEEWNELRRKRKISGENWDNVQSEDGAQNSTVTISCSFPIGLVGCFFGISLFSFFLHPKINKF